MQEYQLPQDIIDVWDDYNAARKARRDAVKAVFKFQLRNAVYCGRIAESKKREFWEKVRNLYPELSKNLVLNTEDMTIKERMDYNTHQRR